MTYLFLQQYWWFLVSLLGALLVFMMFVQGTNSIIFSLGRNDVERGMLVNSTGRKWKLTFTTLVTFGGAFFASFPLFYSTSFGGAYWLWIIILFTFVLQAVSYEFQKKLGNILGVKTFQTFLVINGWVAPFLIGVAVATFFTGSNFVVEKANFTNGLSPVISSWANGSNGLDALLDVWNIVLGLAVMFLARVTGILYTVNSVSDIYIRQRSRKLLRINLLLFLVTFLAFLIYVLVKDGYAYDPATGNIFVENGKYLSNFLALWPLAVMLVVGVVLFLYGTGRTVFDTSFNSGIWTAGIGEVLVVLSLLLCAGLNNTAYYPSAVDLQSSLTIQNSCSSEFTLSVMSVVSLLIPFVLAYIVYVWRIIDRHKINREMVEEGE